MHPLNSRTTNTVAAVKNWTFIGRSLKKYLYGIRLINWRAESYWTKCELYTIERARWWRIAFDIFSYSRSRISPVFSSDLQKKFQRYNNTLYCDSVPFLFLRLVPRDGLLTKHTRTNSLGQSLGYPRRDLSHPFLSLYVCLFMIFIHLIGAALDCACSISLSRGKFSIQRVSLK